MQKLLPLLMLSLSCFALGSCKDVPLGADGVAGRGGGGGNTGNIGGVTATGGLSGTGRCPAGETLCPVCESSICATTCPIVNCAVNRDAGSAGGAGAGGATSAGGSAGTSLIDNVALQELLASWDVTEVRVRGDEIWFNLAAACPECPVEPARSSLPQKYKLVVLGNGGIKSFAFPGEDGFVALTMDSQQGVFAVAFGRDVANGVVALSGLPSGAQSLQDIRPLFPTQVAYKLAIDSDGSIWVVSDLGLQKWDGTTAIVYDSTNSEMPTTEVHGLAIDKHGAKWVGLGWASDSKPAGIMKILGNSWQLTPYSSIGALASSKYYATVECVDRDNNLWVSSFAPGSDSVVIRYDGASWIPEGTGSIFCDHTGTAWNVKESFNNTTGRPSALDVTNSLAYWDQGTWRPVDVSGITWRILSLDVYRTTLILGTLKGVAFVDGIGTGGAGGASGTGGTTGANGGTTGANGGTTGANGGTTGASGGTTSSPDAGVGSSCENPLPLKCGDRLNHSTLVQGRDNVWGGYNETQRAESGREAIYLLQTTAACQVVAQLKNLTVDLDLFRMSSCRFLGDTVASSTPLDLQTIETVRFATQPGQPNFVVVDGYNGAAGTYTLEVDCACDQDAGTIDAPTTDAQGDTGISPGCDLDVAAKTMATFGLITWGSLQTSNATLPAVLATDANWGLKVDVCRQAGYDITALVGKTVCLAAQDINQTCQGNPSTAWVMMNNGAVACVYKAVRQGFGSTPGVYGATDARCTPPVIAPGATVACEGGFCTNASGPCCPATNMMNRTGMCWSNCPTAAMTCDGPEDCSNGAVCCSQESTAGGFAAASCAQPAECVAPSRVICHQQTDCVAPQKCGAPNPAPTYVSTYPYPESGYWRVGFQVCAP